MHRFIVTHKVDGRHASGFVDAIQMFPSDAGTLEFNNADGDCIATFAPGAWVACFKLEPDRSGGEPDRAPSKSDVLPFRRDLNH